MTTKLINYLTLILLALVASTSHAETTRCTVISTLPINITKQGAYCLNRNLSTKIATGGAITVIANNVSIDLNGHALVGLAPMSTTSAFGIYAVNRQNITIRNGSIRGFQTAIYLLDSSTSNTASQRHLIEDIRVSKNKEYGIFVWGSDNIVQHNQVVDTGGSTRSTAGMYIRGRSARVRNNDISRTRATKDLRAFGLLVENAPGAVVVNNHIDNVSNAGGVNYGLQVSNSKNVLASGNRISSAKFGIAFDSFSPKGKYMDNLTTNVTTPFSGGTAVGIND